MDRIARNRALYLAHRALYDLTEQAHTAPIPPSIQLRALLSLIALHGKGDRKAYADFWKVVCKPHDPDGQSDVTQNYVRSTYARTMLYGIERDLPNEKIDEAYKRKVTELIERDRKLRP